MPIVVNLDVMMARRHKGAGELAEEIGITPANLSILKNNKAKAVRFSTLEALCTTACAMKASCVICSFVKQKRRGRFWWHV